MCTLLVACEASQSRGPERLSSCRGACQREVVLTRVLYLPRMHVVRCALLSLLLVAVEVAADELGETSLAQDAAASEFEDKVAAAIRQSLAEGWAGPSNGYDWGAWDSPSVLCVSQLLEFCSSDPAPAFCAPPPPARSACENELDYQNGAGQCDLMLSSYDDPWGDFCQDSYYARAGMCDASCGVCTPTEPPPPPLASTCSDTIRADYVNYYNTAGILTFGFPVCEGGWPCWDRSYAAGECWRSEESYPYRLCAWKGVSCFFRTPDGRRSQDPSDLGGGTYFLDFSLDISDFPPANESARYSVVADLSGCNSMEEMCATLFQNASVAARLIMCSKTRCTSHCFRALPEYMEGDFLAPGKPFMCPTGWVRKKDLCTKCVAEGNFANVQKIALILGLPLALCILYNFASISWRPSGRDGVEAAVYSGAFAPEASKAWRDRLAAHLDVALAEIRADHPGVELVPGDDVLIGQLSGSQKNSVTKKKTQLSKLNGHVGTVLRASNGEALVCVHGISGQWKLPVKSLTAQPLFAETPQDAPACAQRLCAKQKLSLVIILHCDVPACAESAFASA